MATNRFMSILAGFSYNGTVKANVGNNTLYVGGTGSGNYSSIQSAINATSSDDTVYVYNGTYNETIKIDKSITLIGEDRNTTVIDGSKSGNVVKVSEDAVKVSGFTIRNSGDWPDAGIDLKSNNTIVNNNIVSNNNKGVHLDSSSNNNIVNNNISNSIDGIYLYSSNDNTIVNNTIESNNNYGIYLLYGSSNNNLIYHNNFKNNQQNAEDAGDNTWYNTTLQEGNYWDDYNGKDSNNDGIGDTPYNISGGDSQDLYPLMKPYK